MGICKDEVIDDYVLAMARSAAPDERHFAARQIADIVLTMDDPKVIARALKALNSLLPLSPGLENELDKRILDLADRDTGAMDAELASAIALLIYGRAQERASVAGPYIPVLLSLLAQNIETTGAYSYYALMIVAKETPAFFGPHADALVRTLDSPGFPAKIFSMRIIAALALSHPEYVAGARTILRNLAETSPPGITKVEAARAYNIVKGAPRISKSNRSRLLDDPAIASLYEMPVWQRAVERHLTTAYGSDLPSVERSHRRRHGIKKEIRPSKRNDLYHEFVEELKQGEGAQGAQDAQGAQSARSFEDQIAVLSPEKDPEATPDEVIPAEIAPPAPPREAEISQPETNETAEFVPPSTDNPADSTGTIFLHEMMNEVQNEFSAQAGSLLDAMGMGHLKCGSAIKVEESSHKITAREFVLAMEKLFKA